MRLRRLCLEIFAFRRFFREPIDVCSACRFPGAQRKHRMRSSATVLSSRGEFAQRFLDDRGVLFGLHFAKDRRDLSGPIDHERAPLRAHVLFPIHAFLNPDSVSLDDFLLRIGQERKRELIFLNELLVARREINADAEDFRASRQVAPGIAQPAGLHRAPRGVVFRIEIENDWSSVKVCETYLAARSVLTANGDGAKLRRRIPYPQRRSIFVHDSKTIMRMPTAQRSSPIITLSYFSRSPSFTLFKPAMVSEVKITMPATVAIESTAVSTAKPAQP